MEPEIDNIQRCQGSQPAEESGLLALIGGDVQENGGQIFAAISEDLKPGRGWDPHGFGSQIKKSHSEQRAGHLAVLDLLLAEKGSLACRDIIPRQVDAFPDHLMDDEGDSATLRRPEFDGDRVLTPSRIFKDGFQRERLLAGPCDLAGAAPNSAPEQEPSLSPLLVHHLGQTEALGAAVEKPKGILDVALAGCVGADEQREWAERYTGVPEALEADEPQ